MAAKTAHDAARAKAAQQKKLLIALVPLLLLALFFAYHTMSKHSGSGSATPPPATTPASTTPSGTPVSAPTTSPAVTPVATPSAGSGKLNGLAQLASKDPFHDQGPHAAVSTTAASTQGATKQKKQSAPPPTAALISVNGHVGTVALGATFPITKNAATNAVFRLVGLTAKAAKVAVVGGSYASGGHTLTLKVNSVVKLVNTADGKRYTLILYPPQQAAVTTTTTTPVTTTTTTTTTTTSGP